VSPQVANAICNSGGKLLKIVEMRQKSAGRALQLVAVKKYSAIDVARPARHGIKD
jgi:hypothetical protein